MLLEKRCLGEKMQRFGAVGQIERGARVPRQLPVMGARAAFLFVLTVSFVVSLTNPPAANAGSLSVVYPPTPRSNVVDTYFGKAVPDPYRWLEETQSLNVKRWLSLEAQLTSKSLAKLPNRETLRSMILGLISAPFDGVPDKGKYATIFSRTVPNLAQPVLMVIRDGRTSTLLDPNARWRDSSTILAAWYLSPDGRVVAYATNAAGGGWFRWHTLSTVDGADRRGTVVGTPDWAPISWARDSSGFYYGGYGSENERKPGIPIGRGFGAFFHRAGTPQSADGLVYARPDHPDWLPYASESWDGRYLILGAVEGSGSGGNLIAIRDLHAHTARTQVLRPLGDAQYSYIDNAGPLLYFQTTASAPRGKVVSIDLRHPSNERDVIPERADVLEDVAAVGGRLVGHYLYNVASQLSVFERSGKPLYNVRLPGFGTAGNVVGEPGDPTGYYTFSSPTRPHTIFSYDVRDNRSIVHFQQRAPFDTRQYVTEELYATSTGGARIPVFVAHRRGLKLDHNTPTMITGYGGFGDAYHPTWQNLSAAWLAGGGVFAIACVRGGGEYGEDWHRAGMRGNKQNAFDDFAAAANLLVDRGFASHATLAAYGYSGGGLLVGVTEVQHPGLFAAVAEEAGPVDVLRGYTYGSESAWTDEVGSPIASLAQFKWLYAYAPLVSIQKGTEYPATLVMTSANDARVSPSHSYKFAATLQWAQASSKPILLYVAAHRGHIEGNRSALAGTLTDTEAFLMRYTRPGVMGTTTSL
jgi:prolyl oligopeptidase